jgi:hypothetical protein
MRDFAKSLLRIILPLRLVLALNRGLRALAAAGGHRLQFWLQRRVAAGQPGWFDHKIDQYWTWPAMRNPGARELDILDQKIFCQTIQFFASDVALPVETAQ